jgi:hypothetical protein
MRRSKPVHPAAHTSRVYCPICTHTVAAETQPAYPHSIVRPGQKCPRCAGSLDPAYIFRASVFRNSRAA